MCIKNTEDYIKFRDNELYIEDIKEFNRKLVDKYPFLLPTNDFDGYLPDNYDYEFTWLDDMPDGWRIAFGDEMVDRINQELIRCDFKDYKLCQIKEKFGGLRWYDYGAPLDSKINDIIREYEDLSFRVCIDCGKPSKYMTLGWTVPLCADCAKKFKDIGLRELKWN